MAQQADPDPVNAVVDTILARRSIRFGFEDRPLAPEHLEIVLRCGLAAPSSKNARPWRFHVVQDTSRKGQFAEAATRASGIEEYVPHDPLTGTPSPHWSSTVRESADVVRVAPAIVAIENRGVFSGGRATLARATPEALMSSLTGYGFEAMGLGAALENIWLAANSLGIGVAYLGDLNIIEPQIQQALGLEGDLMGVIALGYASLWAPARREPPSETQVDTPVVWH